uniref:Uncharacterized protein n=1 Tax=Arundo donax TaxID=35708 RepID=A0A0A9PTX6_ARUDO
MIISGTQKKNKYSQDN